MNSSFDDMLFADIAAAQRGDRAAYSRIVDATRNVVCSIALAIVRDVNASEDVAQDVFVNAWQNLAQLREKRSFLPWLKQLTRNRALNFLRLQRRTTARHVAYELGEERSTSVDWVARAEEQRILAECLEKLPDSSRELLILFYWEGSSVSQVAALLDLSETVVKKRLERARAALREGVLERFAEAATHAAPTAAFTAAVSGALISAAPAAASAMSLGALKTSTTTVAAASSLSAVLMAIPAGLGGIFLGHVAHISDAQTKQMRRELALISLASGLLLIAWVVGFSACVAAKASSVVLFATYAGFVACLGALYGVSVPRVLKLNDADANPTAVRRHRWFMVAFVLGAIGGAATLLFAVFKHG